ncbi:YkvI family membrane protein [Anaerococcus cruorum]|uniref:YkvI family membrane protein n=1 Tax=Anaerococcus sp. WGS1529 TaxID=3366812 RepID=UPI00372D76A8
MNKKSLVIMLAYVGVVTGAGLASGQELLQYFVSLGIPGLVGAGVVGLLHTLIGGVLLQLGSHYMATDHSEVFGEITNKYMSKFMDYSLIFTCFVIGFVMIAGAGSNLNEAFGIKKWIGQVISAGLIIVIGMMDFEKVSKIIGSFTPLIIIFTLIGSLYTFFNYNPNWNQLNNMAIELPSNFNSVIFSTFNYYGMCLMSGVSMGLVLGGEELNTQDAGIGGLLGGAIAGILGILISFTLFIRVGEVGKLDIPMLYIIEDINPILGVLMALVIFGMIFNTGISLFYALARRFSKGEEKRFKIFLIVLTLIGFVLSFGGFKELVSIFYPIIGYVGILMMIVLVAAWYKERSAIKYESYKRLGISHYMRKKVDDNEDFSKEDEKRLEKLIERSNIDNEQIEQAAEDFARSELEEG